MKKMLLLVAMLFAFATNGYGADYTAPLGSDPAYSAPWRITASGQEKRAFATYVANDLLDYASAMYGYQPYQGEEQVVSTEVLRHLQANRSRMILLGGTLLAMNSGGGWVTSKDGSFTNRSEVISGIYFQIPLGDKLYSGLVVTKPGEKTGVICSNIAIEAVGAYVVQQPETEVAYRDSGSSDTALVIGAIADIAVTVISNNYDYGRDCQIHERRGHRRDRRYRDNCDTRRHKVTRRERGYRQGGVVRGGSSVRQAQGKTWEHTYKKQGRITDVRRAPNGALVRKTINTGTRVREGGSSYREWGSSGNRGSRDRRGGSRDSGRRFGR
jgi:hypothetical protein